MTPLAELRYRQRDVDDFVEVSGGLATLAVSENDGDMLISTVGVEFSVERTFADWTVRPTGGLRYSFVPSSESEVDVRYVGTGVGFQIEGAEMSDQAYVNAGVELERGRLAIFGGTAWGFGDDEESRQFFGAGVRYRF